MKGTVFQKPKGKLGLTKVNLWVPSALHAAAVRLSISETAAGRSLSISKIYTTALGAFVGPYIGQKEEDNRGVPEDC